MPSPRAYPDRCPCGSGEPYTDCCGPLHRGKPAATAEQLMRSRYAAFAVGDRGYLLESWHPRTRPDHLRLDPRERWTGLTLLRRSGGGLLDAEGTVEFRAHYVRNGRPGVLHERSRFVRHEGRWAYLSAS